MRADLEALEAELGHRFANREILHRALTHSSLVHERNPGEEPIQDNEKLEFLGDSVLGFLISEELMRRFPDAPEGRLSKWRAHLVSSTHLHEVAQRLRVGQYLQLGRGEEMSGGRSKKTLLVNSLEALIAALYLDGGLDAARRFVMRSVAADSQEAFAPGNERTVIDFKSALQELAQAHRLPPPRYTLIKEQGPEHAKTFTVEVRVGREFASQAEGLTKKAAAQKAARKVFEMMGVRRSPPFTEPRIYSGTSSIIGWHGSTAEKKDR